MTGAAPATAVRLRTVWRTWRGRHPAGARRLGVLRTALRRQATLVTTVAELRGRVHELERDHALLAEHVAALTGRIEHAGAPDTDTAPDTGVEERIAAARLGAIAAYEQRLEAVEAATRAGGRQPRERSGNLR